MKRNRWKYWSSEQQKNFDEKEAFLSMQVGVKAADGGEAPECPSLLRHISYKQHQRLIFLSFCHSRTTKGNNSYVIE